MSANVLAGMGVRSTPWNGLGMARDPAGSEQARPVLTWLEGHLLSPGRETHSYNPTLTAHENWYGFWGRLT
jgi:hypothetical protein